MNEAKLNEMIELKKIVEAGAEQEALNAFLLPFLTNRRGKLVEMLESDELYYQKIDNSELIKIQLELRLIKQIVSEAESLVVTGEEARAKINELNQPEKKNKSMPMRY